MVSSDLRLDDAQDYLAKLIATLAALDRREKGPLLAVLEYLSRYIANTRGEILALRQQGGGSGLFDGANDELGEIVAETARATNRIMEATEAIESLTGTLDPQFSSRILDVTTRIYEACSFQDITGQRISKVVRALGQIEERVAALAAACGDGSKPAATDGRADRGTGDAALLHGPQLARDAVSQDEIDRLFEKL
jgi:chemotaxis protein CheZ